MTTMTPDHLAELRRLAGEATAGPWAWEATGPGKGDIALGGAADPDGEFAILTPYVCESCRERGASCLAPNDADAAYIAAVSPDVVLALLEAARREARVRTALETYGEHQHHWVPTPTQRHENGVWRDAVEPEEGWDRMGVDRLCPDEATGECWCGLTAALQEGTP